MVIVDKVNWIDKEGEEADVVITDGIYSVLCFSCPFTQNKN